MVEVTYKDGDASFIDRLGQEVWVWDAGLPSDPKITILSASHGASLSTDMVVELVAILNHWLDTGRIEARND